MSRRSEIGWARLLLFWKVVRVPFDDDVLIRLIERGGAEGRPVEGDEDVLDVRLTEKGLNACRKIGLTP